jgi:hypothetical protein
MTAKRKALAPQNTAWGRRFTQQQHDELAMALAREGFSPYGKGGSAVETMAGWQARGLDLFDVPPTLNAPVVRKIKCACCHASKTPDEFSRRGNGYRSYCKLCERDLANRRYKNMRALGKSRVRRSPKKLGKGTEESITDV